MPSEVPLPPVEIPNPLEPSDTFLDDIRESIGPAQVPYTPLENDPGVVDVLDMDPGLGVLTPANLNVEEEATELRLTSTRKRKPVNKWEPDDDSEIANYAAKAVDTRDIVKPM